VTRIKEKEPDLQAVAPQDTSCYRAAYGQQSVGPASEQLQSCLKMESDISQAFHEELTCFICLGCLTDPVTISCGHSFCRVCLQLSWEDIQHFFQCPMCREPSQKKDLRTNIVLKNLVSMARQTGLMKDLSSEERKCVSHKETKRIFCAENRIFLCQLCSNSHEHRGHRHCPIEAAAEGQMEKLLKQMAFLWDKIQKSKENIKAENRMRILFMNYLNLREEIIRTEYRKLHSLPCEEEEKHIECMRNEGQSVLEELATSEAMMVQKSKQLREMYQELMAMSQEPYVVLLQEPGAPRRHHTTRTQEHPDAIPPQGPRSTQTAVDKDDSRAPRPHWTKRPTLAPLSEAKMGRRQCKSAYNIIKNKTTPESSPPPTPKSDYCNADKAEENDLKKSLMKMLEEAFEEKMKNLSKEIGENTNKKLEEINKEIEEKKSKKLEEMNNEIEEKKNKNWKK
ncbi:hypothetical protein STEG23_020536, partial [Scotinomys teguina]